MGESKLSLLRQSKAAKLLQHAVVRALPEWQIFIRHHDGRGEFHTVSRRRQLVMMAGVSLLAFWAGVTTVLLSREPEELAAKERHLDELMAATRTEQYRLVSSQKVVGDIAREVDSVHANLRVLADSSAALAKDGLGVALPTRPRQSKDMADMDDGPSGADAKAMREQVRRLETSLDRLQQTYTKVVSVTTATAKERVGETERLLNKLGLSPERLLARQQKEPGRGGPFIPVPSVDGDRGLGSLMEQMDRWAAMKQVMRHMPLGTPIHAAFEITSPFGTRNDPLNSQTGMHEGIDFSAPYATPIYATGDGIVTFADDKDRYGNTVDVDHGGGVLTRYAHLAKIKVKVGQTVSRSTVLGLLGNTGRSTGPHLHYEVRVSEVPRNPHKFITVVGSDAPQAR